MKKGTSAPSCEARLRSLSVPKFKPQSSFRPFRTAAASEEAPPRPAEIGMLLWMIISIFVLIFWSLFMSFRALWARLFS